MAGQLKTNLRRRTRASSESDIFTTSSSASAASAAAAAAAASPSSAEPDRSRVLSDAPLSSSLGSAGGGQFYAASELAQADLSPLRWSPTRRRGRSTPGPRPSAATAGAAVFLGLVSVVAAAGGSPAGGCHILPSSGVLCVTVCVWRGRQMKVSKYVGIYATPYHTVPNLARCTRDKDGLCLK